MKAITLCFALVFTQVVVGSKVRYSHRAVRQSPQNADVGQLQQPPVAALSAELQDTSPSSISSTNVAAAVQNTQPAQTILAPNALENNQLAANSLAPTTSQIPSNPMVATFTVPDFSAQIPPPNQSPPSPTPPMMPSNPMATAPGIPVDFTSSTNTPVQVPSQMYPYNPSVNFGRSAAYPPTPYANQMVNPNMQQFYNPYYSQYPQAYMNPQMMYGMPSPYPSPPMQYMPPYVQPPQMYAQPPYTNSTSARSSSPYPYPFNSVQAPNTADDSAAPTIMSSTGESGSDLNSLPPQVKEFMDMIPQILSMHESSPAPGGHEMKRPPLRKLPKVPPSSLLKKKQFYQSNYPSSAYSDYPQRYGYYY